VAVAPRDANHALGPPMVYFGREIRFQD
jgi:hypothetical protein